MVWILADDRMGNVNQLLGIAEALELPYERKDIRYTKWVRLPNIVRGCSLIGITDQSVEGLTAPWPDIVLSAGRRSFPVAGWIKKQSQGKTKIVQLMNPGVIGFKKADLVVLPMHDRYKGTAKNVMRVCGTPHRVTSKRLNDEREKWQNVFGRYKAPRLSLIVGGATKNKPFTVQMAHQLVDGVLALKPASVCVTTSRRTPTEVISILRQRLPQESFFYEFGDKTENPYFGLLAWADLIVVTGDSMSMCSECCASQTPVFIFAPGDMVSDKHKRFHAKLYQEGYASPLGEYQKEQQNKIEFNPAIEIAKKIKEMF